MVKNIVLNYILTNNVDYAIMIRGAWGCGKTFYWNNVLKKAIEEKRGRDSVIYVSLNGLKTVNDISNRLIMYILKMKTNGIVSEKTKTYSESFIKLVTPFLKNIKTMPENFNPVLNIINGMLSSSLNISILLESVDFSKKIICFDDVERYKGDIEELMGYFYGYIEQRYAHVILIANEKEINSDSYRKIKEKTIGKTVQFNLKEEDIIMTIIEGETANDFEVRGFLKRNIHNIVSVIKKISVRNYRVIRMLIKEFVYIYDRARNILLDKERFNDKSREVARLSLLKFTLAIGMEIHINAVDKNSLKEIKNIESSILQEMLHKEKTNIKNYFHEFKTAYYNGIAAERDFFPSVATYLAEGYMDFTNFENELIRYAKKEYSALDYLLTIGYWKMSDDEFSEQIEKNLMQRIEEGKIPINLYKKLFVVYSSLSKKKLILLTVNEIKEKFIHGLTLVEKSDQDIKELDELDDYTDRENLDKLDDDIKNAYNTVSDKVKNVYAIIRNKKTYMNSCNYLDLMKNDFEKALRIVFPSYGTDFYKGPLFLGIEPQDIFEILKKQENSNIIEFRNMLLNREYYVDKSVIEIDRKYLKKLSSYIKKEIAEEKHLRLSQSLLMQLANDIVERI